MTAEELTTILYRKMKAEQDTYRDWLLGLLPEEILDHAYEYSVREDILMALEERDVTVEQGGALLDSPSPLADIYREWQKLETRYMEDVRDTIESRANHLVFQEQAGAD
ncbi:DUF3848 domain-containing protein [Anaerotruncus sp. 1XD42-93]|uniref:DUF3848 domain-containing protein n=1 Tax=Anaerotruncus sp. 1XD42-93 TaxID=2320853 RepID=UPI000EA1847B|nr:DUF3848 domain-containing protein [Anaerotruncus sp. 1XD42-93]NBK19804.1 DUF3848 domain-containing protein [Anaerotruncus sp. 1XD42-93]RKJ77467.1 DUF3848 domain-containing protein [Anaerotruncus sp. 1XD22-93]